MTSTAASSTPPPPPMLHGLTAEQWASCRHDFYMASLYADEAIKKVATGTLTFAANRAYAVIAFCRPFSGNQDASGKKWKLPVTPMHDTLTGVPADRAFYDHVHEKLMACRDKFTAHSDAVARRPYFTVAKSGDEVDWHGADEGYVPEEYLPIVEKLASEWDWICVRALVQLAAGSESASTGSGHKLGWERAFDLDPTILKASEAAHYSKFAKVAAYALANPT